MGGWKLEAFKMTLYMSFPVGIFWWFNRPALFEKWMMSQREKLFPPEDSKGRALIQQTIEDMEANQQAKMEAQFAKNR